MLQAARVTGSVPQARKSESWEEHYIDYHGLKELIKAAAAQSAAVGHNVAFSPRTTSLTVQRGQSLNKNNAELDFFNKLDAEVLPCAPAQPDRPQP